MQGGSKLVDMELEDMPADRLTAEDLQELYEEQMKHLACREFESPVGS